MVDLSLSPVFYHQVGPTCPQTMKIIPATRRGAQKVAIGDHDGVLTCFGMKRGDSTIVFKTLPGPKITRVSLGAPGVDRLCDNIFFSAGAEIRGFSKKGKQFLKFDTNLTEPIQSFCVDKANLMVCGSYIYNRFLECRDTDYFLSSDRINDVLCLPPDQTATTATTGNLYPVLACQDCTLRVIKSSELLYEVEVAGPPICVTPNGKDGGEDGEEVLYGTENGRIGLVKLQSTEPTYRWDMLNERKYGGVACLATSDLTGDGVEEILVGRDDGVVEVFALDESEEPQLKFTHIFTESITAIGGGTVGSAKEEVVVATYSGRVLGLTQDPVSSKPISHEVAAKIEALKQEVESLQSQLHTAKDKYQQNIVRSKDQDHAHHPHKGGGGGVGVSLTALAELPVKDKFVMAQDDSWYTLTLELQVPIDTLMLQSDVPVDLQEVDKTLAVISYTPPDPENNNYLLATFRCNDTKRMEVRVRSIEGQYGSLLVYVTPQVDPKCCKVLSYTIKPLSLHRRTHSFDESIPCNKLKVTGSFSLAEAHSWVRFCLPDVPERPPAEDSVTLQFISTFIDTQLECTYKKGEAVFSSDNLSTISVLKEVLSKEATQRKIAIRTKYEIDQESVPHMLRLIYPKLEQQLMLAKNVQLIESLQELKLHEQDTSFLSPQCQHILENADKMQEDFKQQPCLIERFYALITDLFVDRANFMGQNVKQRVPDLLKAMDNCDLDSLLDFFKN